MELKKSLVRDWFDNVILKLNNYWLLQHAKLKKSIFRISSETREPLFFLWGQPLRQIFFKSKYVNQNLKDLDHAK